MNIAAAYGVSFRVTVFSLDSLELKKIADKYLNKTSYYTFYVDYSNLGLQ